MNVMDLIERMFVGDNTLYVIVEDLELILELDGGYNDTTLEEYKSRLERCSVSSLTIHDDGCSTITAAYKGGSM